MKEIWVMSAMLGLLFFFISAQESLVFGQTDSSFGQSSVVIGVYDNKGLPSTPVSLNIKQWTATDSPSQATKNWQTTIVSSNNKGNQASFTKASNEHILPTLSTRLVAKSQLNEFIKSLLSTNVLPENLSTRYSASLNTQNTQKSIFNDKEDSSAISSVPSAMTPEIVPTTSQVNGIIKTSSLRDKIHLTTFQKEDKSLVSSQEAFTKSAFFDPRGKSKEFNLWTVRFTSSNSILVEINSATVVRALNETNLFTKGSVSLTNGQGTFSIRSAIWKTAELKPFSEATSHSSHNKETVQHDTQTFNTKMDTVAMKIKFTGISGILKTTAEAKLTPEDKGFISPLTISTSHAIKIATTSVEASAAHSPPILKHKNFSLSSVVTASPIVSSRSKRPLSTNTMTIPTTPLAQLSVTSAKSSKFSSRTETEFRALTKGIRASSSAVPKHSNQSIYEFTPFVVSIGTLRFSELSQGMQTVSSMKSKTSEQNYVMSSSSEDYFPISVNTTENVVQKASLTLKLISEVLDKNPSSPYLSQTMLKTHSTDWAVSTASEQFSSLNSGSNLKLPISSSVSDIDHHSSFSQSSVMSPVPVAPSPSPAKSRSKIPDAVTSTLGVRHNIDSSSQRLFAITSLYLHTTRRSTIPLKSSNIHTDGYQGPPPSTTKIGYQIRLSSSQTSAASSKLLAPSSSSMTSYLHVPYEKTSAITSSYHEPLISTSEMRYQSPLSSPLDAPLSTEPVESPSTLQSHSQVPQEKRSFVKQTYYQTIVSTSDTRHQFSFTSSHSSVVSSEYVARSSSPVISSSKMSYRRNSSSSQLQSRSLIVHGANSSVTNSHQKYPTSSMTGHQIQFSSRRPAMSIASPSSSFLKSPSQIAHKGHSVSGNVHSTNDLQSGLSSQSLITSTELLQPSSYITSHYKRPLTTTSVTRSISHEPLPSTSKIGHHDHFSSAKSLVGSTELVAPSQHTKSHFQTSRSTVSVTSSTFHKNLLSTSDIGRHDHFSSAQSLVGSTESVAPSPWHTNSHFQTSRSTASVTSSTFHEHLPSTSNIGHHAHLSSAKGTVASSELVAPSSHPKISSHVPQKRSSAGSNRTPSSYSRSSVDKAKLKTSSLSVSATQPGKEFSSKINIPPVPVASIDTTVTPTKPTTTSSPAVAGNLSTEQPTTTATNAEQIKLLIMVAIVPSIVLCAFFTAVMLFRRKRRRRNNFKYSIKLEYKDSIRSMNSRLDLSLKGVHIDLELPNVPSERAQSRDSTGYSRGPSLTETQMRELQILSQECKENLEWISEVIARDMETSICPRQALNRESVYSVKEKGSYEPSAKIVRRESSKRGRETVTWRVPIVRRRDSGEFDQRDSICTDDTTLTHDWREEGDFERSTRKNVDRTGKVKQSPHVKRNVESHVTKDPRGQLCNKTLDEQEKQKKDKKIKELEENKLNVSVKPQKGETSQGKRSGKRFETL